MDRAIHFYSIILGFHLVSRDAVARFDVDGVLLELVSAQEGHKVAGKGNARLCLRVDDVELALGELQGQGVTTGLREDKQDGVLGTLHDPDGNEICLWQYKP